MLGDVEVDKVTEVVVHVHPYYKTQLLSLSSCHKYCYHIFYQQLHILLHDFTAEISSFSVNVQERPCVFYNIKM